MRKNLLKKLGEILEKCCVGRYIIMMALKISSFRAAPRGVRESGITSIHDSREAK